MPIKKEYLQVHVINKLIKTRSELLKNLNKHAEADAIQFRITNSFKNHFHLYACDFILETLTMFGLAPNLVYDDNGKFAVSCQGYQPVVTGNERIAGALTIVVEKNMWKSTIRAALFRYVKHLPTKYKVSTPLHNEKSSKNKK